MRFLAASKRFAVPRTDDVWTITRIVEMWRIGGFMASHADGSRHVRVDVSRRVGGVEAARTVTHLTLDVLAPFAVVLETGAAGGGPTQTLSSASRTCMADASAVE